MPKIFPLDYDQYDLPNGLRLITVPAPYPNIVSLQIVVQAGSRNEVEPGKSGFAHFFEHMMFRGTPEFPPERYEAVLQETGASSNAYTDDDRTVYHTTVSKEDIESILAMESDRFRNLEYSLEAFQTEALAVYGEYNKDSAEPLNKLLEVLREHAFSLHPYQHTTMGFLRDIVDMPNQFDYSRLFFERFYRPEYTTLILAGDITAPEARAMVERHWGMWQRGGFQQVIPQDTPLKGPLRAHIPWTTETLPYLMIGFRSAAYSDELPDAAALDLISFLGFADSSALYEELVMDDQVVDLLWSSNSDHVDPYLFSILARVKDPARMAHVEERILATLAQFVEQPVEESRLAAVKKHLRYRFALSMNHSEAIASVLAHYVSLRRTPETINRLYELYDRLTPESLQSIACKYFREDSKVTVTLFP